MNNNLQVNLPRTWAGSNSSLQEKSEHSFFLFYYYRMEDEAVLDRGASFLKHVCDEEEVEGKRLWIAGDSQFFQFLFVYEINQIGREKGCFCFD